MNLRRRQGYPSVRLTAHAVLLLAMMLVTGCGFHLRDAYQLPEAMQATYIQAGNEDSEMVRSLRRQLRVNDVQLTRDAAQATAVLRLYGEGQSRRVISVDSRGRAREYELTYRISFSVEDAQKNSLIEEQTLTLQRDFLFDTEDVLGKGREEATLISDMQQDMVRLIMLRLQAAHSTDPAAESSGTAP